MHLNLSGLGLNKLMADVIISSIRKTLSLVCLHLSGNPFLRELDLDALRELVRAKPKVQRKDFVQPCELLQVKDVKELLITNRLQIWKRVRRQDLQLIDPFINETLVFQRKLGHKDEMPGQGQWEILSGKERPEPSQ